MYSEPGNPLFVPVGEDQVSHVEISREIVRRFNTFYRFRIDLERVRSDAQKLKNLRKQYPSLPPSATDDEVLETYRVNSRLSALMSGISNFLEGVSGSSEYFSYEEQLTEPAVMLTKTPRIPGLDGRKMSKSYGNAITLSESDDDIRKKTKVMKTDPQRQRRTDPGNPDVCPVYDWHKLFSTPDTLAWAAEGCRPRHRLH
jgi:tryptophanyl-tRNA synthetase